MGKRKYTERGEGIEGTIYISTKEKKMVTPLPVSQQDPTQDLEKKHLTDLVWE